MDSEQDFTAPKVELDEEGFFKSFDINTCSLEEVQQCYHKYGLVVFKNVITPEEVELSINDLWDDTISFFGQYRENSIKRDDPSTWN